MAGSVSIGPKVTFGPLGPRLRRGYDPQVPGGTGTRSARDPRGGYMQISGSYYSPDTACNFIRYLELKYKQIQEWLLALRHVERSKMIGP